MRGMRGLGNPGAGRVADWEASARGGGAALAPRRRGLSEWCSAPRGCRRTTRPLTGGRRAGLGSRDEGHLGAMPTSEEMAVPLSAFYWDGGVPCFLLELERGQEKQTVLAGTWCQAAGGVVGVCGRQT